MTEQTDVPPPSVGAPPDASPPGAAADRLRAALTDRLAAVSLPPKPPSGAPPILRPGGPVATVLREKRWATVEAPPPVAQDSRKERLDNVDRLLRDCLKSAREAALAQLRQTSLPAETGDVRWFLPARETVTSWLADEVAALAKT